MTHPIDTTPEAIAAIIARYTQAFGLASEAYDKGCRNAVKEMAAEIARLTTDRDALSVELHEARMQAISDGAQFQMAMEDLAAERDEARALLAVICTDRSIGHAAPPEASAALAARDAAMRNEGRKSVKVKPLVWGETHDDRGDGLSEHNGGYWSNSPFGDYEISMGLGPDGEYWSASDEGGSEIGAFGDPDSAKAAAQADYEARILAALEPEGGE